MLSAGPGTMRELIPRAVLIALSQKGKTISMLEDRQGRKYEGDESQKKNTATNPYGTADWI